MLKDVGPLQARNVIDMYGFVIQFVVINFVVHITCVTEFIVRGKLLL